MTELEENLERRCVKVLEAKGVMALKLAPKGARGFPDRTVLMPGASIWFIEFKRPGGGITSVQQKKWAKDLRALGFSVYLISSDKEFHNALKDQERPARLSGPGDNLHVRKRQGSGPAPRGGWQDRGGVDPYGRTYG